MRGKTAEAIEDAEPQGRPRAAGRSCRAGRDRWRSRPCPATCRSSTTASMADLFKSQLPGRSTPRTSGKTPATAPARPTWAISPTSCRPSTRTSNGFSGTGHGSDWAIEDQYLVYVLPAKLMAMTVIDLLAGNGETARQLLDTSKPPMTKDEYLSFMRRNARNELFDGAAVGPS